MYLKKKWFTYLQPDTYNKAEFQQLMAQSALVKRGYENPIPNLPALNINTYFDYKLWGMDIGCACVGHWHWLIHWLTDLRHSAATITKEAVEMVYGPRQSTSTRKCVEYFDTFSS